MSTLFYHSVGLMAFMDFLKKTKKDIPGDNALDVPPPPPLPGGDAFDDFPSLDDDNENHLQMNNRSNQNIPDNDFGAPPYPQPPKMARINNNSAPQQQGIKFPKPQDFGLDSHPGLKSREELGLNSADDEDKMFSDNSSNEDNEQEMSMPPKAPSADYSSKIQMPDLDNDMRDEETGAILSSKAMPKAPAQIPAPSSAPKIQTSSILQQQTQEPSDDELEAPPVPAKNYGSGYQIFDSEYKQAEAERRTVNKGGPLFVTMTEFRDVLEKNDFVKVKLKEANDTIERVTSIESSINIEYEKWRRNIADLQKMFLLVDKKVFELEG